MSIKLNVKTPTVEFYSYLDKAYSFFNEKLFGGSLPNVIFETTNKRGVGGFLRINAWQDVNNSCIHGISINPHVMISLTPIGVYSTIVHEQAHLKIFMDGKEKTKKNYHSKAWAELMEGVGLMPSSTGKLGGKKTGQKMKDYPIPGGLFEQAWLDFILDDNYIKFVDASVDDSDVLKLKNKLISNCVKNDQSLAEHYLALAGQHIRDENNEVLEVVDMSIDDYIDDSTGESSLTIKSRVASSDSAIDDDDELVYVWGSQDSTFTSVSDAIISTVHIEDVKQEKIDKIDSTLAELITRPMSDIVSIDAASETTASDKKKKAYICSKCSVKCWGKPSMSIVCGLCNNAFEEI